MEIKPHAASRNLFCTFLVLICCCCSSQVSAISCLPCIPSECPQLNYSSCPYGMALDYCQCCNACLKGPGESCGEVYGQCYNGSRCLITLEFGESYIKYIQAIGKCEDIEPAAPSSQPPLPSPTLSTSVTTVTHYTTSLHPQLTPSAVSQPIATVTITTTANCSYSSATETASPMPTTTPTTKKSKSKCRTPCSKTFCHDGLNRYCSANSTFSKPRNTVEARIPCQHTTCLACKFVVKHKCPTCPEPVTKRCLRHFELCLDEHYARNDILLEMTDPRVATAEGEIVCDVPELYLPEDEGSGDM